MILMLRDQRRNRNTRARGASGQSPSRSRQTVSSTSSIPLQSLMILMLRLMRIHRLYSRPTSKLVTISGKGLFQGLFYSSPEKRWKTKVTSRRKKTLKMTTMMKMAVTMILTLIPRRLRPTQSANNNKNVIFYAKPRHASSEQDLLHPEAAMQQDLVSALFSTSE